MRPAILRSSDQGFGVSARMPSVAPKSRAASSLSALLSMATTRAAPARRAPWMAFRPTPPAPITTTTSPGLISAVCTAAPSPVMTPQDRSDAASIGIPSGKGAIWLSSTTTRSAKAAQLRPCATALPSGRVRTGARLGGAAQRVGWPPAQGPQWPQDRISVTSTASPGFTRAAPGPTAETRPAASCP